MLYEDIKNWDRQLTEDDFYEALNHMLADAYPHLSEEELEDLLDDYLDQLPAGQAEALMDSVANVAKQVGGGALDFIRNNPGLVKGIASGVGMLGGPAVSMLAGKAAGMATNALAGKPNPSVGKVTALVNNPQVQTALVRGTLGLDTAPHGNKQNGQVSQMPLAIYLRAIIASAQAALVELEQRGGASAGLSEAWGEDVDGQAEWLAEDLGGELEESTKFPSVLSGTLKAENGNYSMIAETRLLYVPYFDMKTDKFKDGVMRVSHVLGKDAIDSATRDYLNRINFMYFLNACDIIFEINKNVKNTSCDLKRNVTSIMGGFNQQEWVENTLWNANYTSSTNDDKTESDEIHLIRELYEFKNAIGSTDNPGFSTKTIDDFIKESKNKNITKILRLDNFVEYIIFNNIKTKETKTDPYQLKWHSCVIVDKIDNQWVYNNKESSIAIGHLSLEEVKSKLKY